MNPNPEIQKLNVKAKEYSTMLQNIHVEMSRVIVGQDSVIDNLILALATQGHILLKGVPGLAKTLLIKTLADCIDLEFIRLQFTPDLLPADIIGTKIYDHSTVSFKTVKGPIFSNFVLVDEINRAPPKVQSALLEAMQEQQVSIQGDTHKIDLPFFVMATQNPIEMEGTYNLPEAQIDRFMFNLIIKHPTKEEEIEIIQRFTEESVPKTTKVITANDLMELQAFVHKIYADQNIKSYITDIVDATRHPKEYGLKIDEKIEYGASPRASLWLALGSKAHAMQSGRGYVMPEDVQAVVYQILRHRIILTYEAQAENITSDDIIADILRAVKVP
ncbi:MAG: ATPase [Cenarchaeum symbiont of Oopsacas minuta]|nr:ATPase [Cenarchaeum symbiont of Oopsacas minuta]